MQTWQPVVSPNVSSICFDTSSPGTRIIEADGLRRTVQVTTMVNDQIVERRKRVQHLHALGITQSNIAKELNVSRMVIRTDFRICGCTSFSRASDRRIKRLVASIILCSHRAVGIRVVESRLLAKGYRVQRHRIRLALFSLGSLREPPKKVNRAPWYEAWGRDGYVILDSFCTVQFYIEYYK